MSKPNADTTKMSPEEIQKLGLQGAKRPPGQSPGGVLHQGGGNRAGRFPLVLGGLLVAVGIGTFTYYRSSHPEAGGVAHSHSPATQNESEEEKNISIMQENNQARMSKKTGGAKEVS
jgi:hypothetical protein